MVAPSSAGTFWCVCGGLVALVTRLADVSPSWLLLTASLLMTVFQFSVIDRSARMSRSAMCVQPIVKMPLSCERSSALADLRFHLAVKQGYRYRYQRAILNSRAIFHRLYTQSETCRIASFHAAPENLSMSKGAPPVRPARLPFLNTPA